MPPFGTVFYTVNCFGWVNDVAWSPNGLFCSAVSHDSKVHVINASDLSAISHTSTQYKGLAFYRVCYTTDSDFYCCGYDRIPIQYTGKDGTFMESKSLDTSPAKAKTEGYIASRTSIFEQPKLGQKVEEIEYFPVSKTHHKNVIM